MSTEHRNYAEQTDESGLSDRGIGVQAAGFAVLGSASLAVLQLFSDSDFWLYLWFEMAATQLYWAFLAPLVALFDWGRIMFAKGKAIREAKKAELEAKFTAQGLQQGLLQGEQKGSERERRRVETVLARHGVELDKEVANELFGDSRSD